MKIKSLLTIFVLILTSCAETQLAVHSAKRILRETDVSVEPKARSKYKIGYNQTVSELCINIKSKLSK